MARPTGTRRLNDAEYGLGAQTEDLRYTAFVDDGGVLNYQWYVSPDAASAGTAIDGAVQSTFTPPADKAGTFYYYCVATNTNAYASQNKTAQSVSGRAKITVVDVEAPVITAQPVSAAYREGDTAVIQRVGGKEEVRRHLENMGFVPGAEITVISINGGNVIVNVKETRVAISKEMANKIMV